MSCISPASISNFTAIPPALPELYWHEALRRDDGDCPLQHRPWGAVPAQRAVGASAEDHLRKAIARLTRRHPNPETGEAHYFLGLTLVLPRRLR